MTIPDQPVILDLWGQLRLASMMPSEADFEALWATLEATLVELDPLGQLEIAAEAISQISQVFYERSTLAFEDLEATASQDGPCMPLDTFDRYVRQTMVIDWELYIAPPLEAARTVSPRATKDRQSQSRVREMSQTELLELIGADPIVDAEPMLKELAGEDNPVQWAMAIDQWWKTHSNPKIRLQDLQAAVGMPLIKVWLGLLFGNFRLEQSGDFYCNAAVWVMPSSQEID